MRDGRRVVMVPGVTDHPQVELHQFLYSHYNEKVRWALEYKRVAHRRIDYLPGPHLPQMRRLSGQSATPVLCIDGKALSGSAPIIEALELRFPAAPLYPSDPEARTAALAFENRCDQELGPASRRLVYDGLLTDPPYIAAMFSQGKAPWKRALYRAAIPLIKEGMRAGNGVSPESVRAGRQTVRALLDDLVVRTAQTGYLVGDAFTIADLTAAALLTPVLAISHPDVAKPEPMPPRLREIVSEFEAHPGSAWVHTIYSRHRRPCPM